jgi:hypothetical protein
VRSLTDEKTPDQKARRSYVSSAPTITFQREQLPADIAIWEDSAMIRGQRHKTNMKAAAAADKEMAGMPAIPHSQILHT